MTAHEAIPKGHSAEEVRSLPLTVDIPTAGRLYGLGRQLAYAAARNGNFPVPVTRIGRKMFVRRSDLMRDLGVAA